VIASAPRLGYLNDDDISDQIAEAIMYVNAGVKMHRLARVKIHQ